MVTVKSRQRAKKFSDFLQLLEEEASRFPVELIPVAAGTCGAPQAVLLLDRTLSAKRKGLLAKAAGAGCIPAKEQRIAPPDNATMPAGAEGFHDRVHAELGRVKESRLPCSLLLIGIAGAEAGSFSKKAAGALQKTIAGEHHLACLDHATLALLLPGHNSSRALRQAGAIQQSLAAATSARVAIGLAVCMARAVPQAEEFVAMARRELRRADQEAGDIFYSFHQQDDDSCQVTAEERAQLFSFLHGGETD